MASDPASARTVDFMEVFWQMARACYAGQSHRPSDITAMAAGAIWGMLDDRRIPLPVRQRLHAVWTQLGRVGEELLRRELAPIRDHLLPYIHVLPIEEMAALRWHWDVPAVERDMLATMLDMFRPVASELGQDIPMENRARLFYQPL